MYNILFYNLCYLLIWFYIIKKWLGKRMYDFRKMIDRRNKKWYLYSMRINCFNKQRYSHKKEQIKQNKKRFTIL